MGSFDAYERAEQNDPRRLFSVTALPYDSPARTEGCGETSHFRFPRGPWRTREAEAPHASRRAHQFQKWASCRLPQFKSCLVLRCPRPSFSARKFNPTEAKTL